MVSTVPDNLWSPSDTDLARLVTNLGQMQATVQAALNSRANAYRGTSAQRTSFTNTAPEGTLWTDTNGTKNIWVKQGANWTSIWPQPHYDSGTVDSFLSASSGWSVVGGGTSWIRRVNNWVVGRVEFNRTGANISVNSRGDITNSAFATLNTAWRPDSIHGLAAAESGRTWTGIVNTGGTMSIAAVGGSENIITGDVFSTRFVFPYRLADM